MKKWGLENLILTWVYEKQEGLEKVADRLPGESKQRKNP